jgi:hypothetical protein
MDKASTPFFHMLERWIYKGIIEDFYSEFFVEEHEEMHKDNLNEDFNDTYWEQRYTVKEVPKSSSNLIAFRSNFPHSYLECQTRFSSLANI